MWLVQYPGAGVGAGPPRRADPLGSGCHEGRSEARVAGVREKLVCTGVWLWPAGFYGGGVRLRHAAGGGWLDRMQCKSILFTSK